MEILRKSLGHLTLRLDEYDRMAMEQLNLLITPSIRQDPEPAGTRRAVPVLALPLAQT
jgi:hypothetical protein